VSAQPTLEFPVRGRRRTALPRLWAQMSRVRRNTIGLAGAAIIAATVMVSFFGPLAWRADYADQAARRLLAPSAVHPLGTDELGRDELSRIIHGAQVSLQVGMISVIIALAIGTTAGVAAGFYGRTVDAVLMRGVDVMFAFPGLVLAIVIAGLLGPSRTNAMMAIGVVYAPAFARVVRGSSLSVLSLPYVEAARSLGISDLRIVLRHLLPNILAPLIVLTTVYLSTAILTEAALSFLGLGTQPPEPSWGGMLNASRSYMERAPWLAVAPGLAIMVVVLGFNFLGDGLRDVLDPQLRDA
jgi:peptide/nickel transport system permease protein